MTERRVVSETMIRNAHRGTLIFAGATLGLAFVLGAGAFANGAAAASATRETASLTTKTKANLAEVAAAPRQEPRTPARAEDQVAALQSRLAAAAAAWGVIVTSFETKGEMAPYISRYNSKVTGGEWFMVPAEVQISGTVRAIYGTLRTLRSGVIPVELTDLRLQPAGNNGDVAAAVSLQIIVRDMKEVQPTGGSHADRR